MAKSISVDPSGVARLSTIQASETPRSVGGEPAVQTGASRDTDRELEMIESLRKAADATAQSRLLIDRDEQGGRFIYKFMDPETGETVRQWPPERYLELVAYLTDQRGGLVDESA